MHNILQYGEISSWAIKPFIYSMDKLNIKRGGTEGVYRIPPFNKTNTNEYNSVLLHVLVIKYEDCATSWYYLITDKCYYQIGERSPNVLATEQSNRQNSPSRI